MINDEKYLFVGGAISIDRMFRRENISYWSDEIFNLKEDKISDCDVLITHSAPPWIGPTDRERIEYFLSKDPSMWDQLVDERKKHDRLIELSKPKIHICGHFHLSEKKFSEKHSCYSRILDILEFEDLENLKCPPYSDSLPKN